ncbi:MAG TPA: molybdate ABC transporter substrate-binding protein [Steroidobacteraceae bacterium]
MFRRARRTIPATLIAIGVVLLALAAGPLHAAELHVAVAANFFGPLKQLAPLFRQASGHELIISSGSSGQLYTQIEQGAPFDVFLSADIDKPRRLEQEGFAVPGSRFTYAVGSLVLWSEKPALIGGSGKVLQSGHYRMIAVANPQTAPYGTAAQQVLTAMGLWERLNREHRVVIGENITQTWQFAASGNVDLAFVALSQVIGPGGAISNAGWPVPQTLYAPIEQGAVILAHSPQRAAAEAFMRWLRSAPAALAIIRSAGYRTAG